METDLSPVYQVALYNGLQSWILDAPRVDILSANKEGICSFIGMCMHINGGNDYELTCVCVCV